MPTTYTLANYANGAAVATALDKALAALPQTGGVIGAYHESGATLTPAAGAVTIPLDGKTYKISVPAAITSISTTLPVAPIVGSTLVYLIQDADGGNAVSIPATWYWPDGLITAIATAGNAITRLLLVSDPDGHVHADAEVRSVPA